MISLLAAPLGGCATSAAPPPARELPPPGDVVLDPAPRRPARPGDDARVAWKREEARADDNERRLIKSREIYTGVRDHYAGGN